MKIIFLDIDGVLNPIHYMKAIRKMWETDPEIKSCDEYGALFFYHNCNALKKIIDTTGAKIVISSSWRRSGESIMKELWQHRNLPGEIIGITPETNFIRGEEIKQWIETNNFTGNYAIIDDDSDMLEEQQPNFILTNGKIGLTFKDADKCIELLNP